MAASSISTPRARLGRISLAKRPATYASSSANRRSRPPHRIINSPASSKAALAAAATAEKLMTAPTNTGLPCCAATRAWEPLVVAMTSVMPLTFSGVISNGEFPQWKPSMAW